jgi:diacylglycerol kinase family enzyme
VAAPLSTPALLKLAVDLFLGTWRESPMVSEEEVGEVTLHFPNRKRGAMAVIDGELIRLDRSVTLKVHPQALMVVRPRVEAVAATALDSEEL